MANGTTLEREVRSIIECSICTRIMKKPKVLPCQHTFCLECLEEHEKINKKGSKLSCPMCRRKFTIPVGGLSKLDCNVLVSKLIVAQSKNKNKKREKVEHFCDHHPTRVMKFYCRDCRITFCVSCYVTNHNNHQVSEMTEYAEKLEKCLLNKCRDIEILMKEMKEQLETIEDYDAGFAEQIRKLEAQVIQTGKNVKQHVDDAVSDLLKQLDSLKLSYSSISGMSKKELESRSVTLHEYYDSCQEIIDSADAFTIVRVADDMNMKANELKSLPIIRISHPPSIKFERSCTNQLGKFSVSKLLLTFIPQGIAISNGTLYVLIPRSSDVVVYTDAFVFQRKITVPGMSIPHDIVANGNVLYISEYEDKVIHRIVLLQKQTRRSDIHVSKWNVDGAKMKLSISGIGNVFAASCDSNKIIEYTPVGDVVREIVVNRIDPTIVGLQHAIQLRGDKFLICHADTNLHRVCIIDNTGVVIESYGGKPGSGRYRLNGPVHLAVDMDENYLIADQHNNRILKLNGSFRYAEVPYDFREPERVLVDDETGRLYLINGMSIETYDISRGRDTPYPYHDDSDGDESRDFSDEDEAGNN